MQPIINQEINEVLKDSVDFSVYFDLYDPKCKIYIKYPGSEKRYIELASGFEKMVSSLAIRVALISLSSLPKLTTLIIDEGFGTLDENRIQALGRLFDSLKDKFKNILIISHIDSVKDMADHIIDIDVDEDGFSQVKHT